MNIRSKVKVRVGVRRRSGQRELCTSIELLYNCLTTSQSGAIVNVRLIHVWRHESAIICPQVSDMR